MSKNREWKASGSPLSFKEWLRQETNKAVQETVAQVNSDSSLSNFVGADGSAMKAASQNYQPNVTGNTIVGINQWYVYGGAFLVAFGIGYVIWYHKTKRKS